MYPLYEDMLLNEAQQELVLRYLQEVNFAIEGTSPSDYKVLPMAKYVGWNFQSEDLEAYAVGLICTKPGFEKYHTFIRMSRGQLLAQADAPRLPVNDPVLATDLFRMQRWRDTPTGPSRTGVDSYSRNGGVPGVTQDLNELHDVLDDIRKFSEAGKTAACEGVFDFQVDFGTLLAGRYPRLKYFQAQGKLSDAEEKRLQEFEEKAHSLQAVLDGLNLPSLRTIATPERRKHPQHHD